MNKPKFSLAKAKKAVIVSSKIEGHKVVSRSGSAIKSKGSLPPKESNSRNKS